MEDKPNYIDESIFDEMRRKICTERQEHFEKVEELEEKVTSKDRCICNLKEQIRTFQSELMKKDDIIKEKDEIISNKLRKATKMEKFLNSKHLKEWVGTATLAVLVFVIILKLLGKM